MSNIADSKSGVEAIKSSPTNDNDHEEELGGNFIFADLYLIITPENHPLREKHLQEMEELRIAHANETTTHEQHKMRKRHRQEVHRLKEQHKKELDVAESEK
jgi:hypothetical protein